MNTYICFWNGKEEKVSANTPLEARNIMQTKYKVINSKRHKIAVMLYSVGERIVTHSTSEI